MPFYICHLYESSIRVSITYVIWTECLCIHRGRGGEKLVIRYARTKWMAPDKCCEIFLYIGPAKYTTASPPLRKMPLFSSTIITFILSYAIIRIYTILHIYLQISKTEGPVELHWVIGLSVLEKTNLVFFWRISFMLSRIRPPS